MVYGKEAGRMDGQAGYELEWKKFTAKEFVIANRGVAILRTK